MGKHVAQKMLLPYGLSPVYGPLGKGPVWNPPERRYLGQFNLDTIDTHTYEHYIYIQRRKDWVDHQHQVTSRARTWFGTTKDKQVQAKAMSMAKSHQ
jgi:hypothetical protein